MRIWGDNIEMWVRGTGFVLELICVYRVIILKWRLEVLVLFLELICVYKVIILKWRLEVLVLF
jgi:hypothetical protein